MSQTLVDRRHQTCDSVGLPISWYFDPGDSGDRAAGIVRRWADLFRAPIAGAARWRLLHARRPTSRQAARAKQRPAAACLERLPASPVADAHGSGHAKNIVCPVHNWAYDLDGCQVAAPHFEKNPCLDLERTELTEWNGLLYAGPRDVRHELAPLASWTELDASNYVLERVDEEEHDLNWKVFLEVYLEDYHISAVHPGFRAFVDPTDLRDAFQAVGGERFFCEQVHVRWPLPQAATPLFAEYQKVLLDVLAGRRPPFAAIWMCLFAGQLVEWYPFTMVATTYTPLSPTRTRLRSEYFFDREIAETRRDYVETSLAVLDEVTGEDQAAAQKLQNGRNALHAAGENAQGPYQMPMEQGLRRFHDCLRAIVQNA